MQRWSVKLKGRKRPKNGRHAKNKNDNKKKNGKEKTTMDNTTEMKFKNRTAAGEF